MNKTARSLVSFAAGFVLALSLCLAVPAQGGGLTITLPAGMTTAQKADVVEAFASAYGWTGTAPDGSVETKVQHFQRRVAEYIRAVYRAEKIKAASTTAGTTAGADADAVTAPL